MEANNEQQQQNQEPVEFSTDIFNITNEPDDFSIILSNTDEAIGIEVGSRRC